MFAPCVGLTVLQIMQALRACGYYHNWAVASLYRLSNFLTYSVLTPLRWTTVAIHILIHQIQEPLTVNPNLYLLIDILHLVITIVDFLNLNENKLTASKIGQNRNSWLQLIALGLMSIVFLQTQWELTHCGFLVFVGADIVEVAKSV